MDPFNYNPFTVFTLIAAPAVLTNASAVMSLTTSNRLARAADRARSLRHELAHGQSLPEPRRQEVAATIEMNRRRTLLLVRALGAFQLAYGSFSAATLVALIGAGLGLVQLTRLSHTALVLSLGCFCVAILATIVGATRIVRETRLAYTVVRDDAVRLLDTLQGPDHPPKA